MSSEVTEEIEAERNGIETGERGRVCGKEDRFGDCSNGADG